MDKKKQKEVILYSVAGVVFLVGLAFVFRPYFVKNKATEIPQGIQTELPDARVVSLGERRAEHYKDITPEVQIATSQEQQEEALYQQGQELEEEIATLSSSRATPAPIPTTANVVYFDPATDYFMSEEEWAREYERNQELYQLDEENQRLQDQLKSQEELERQYQQQIDLLERTFEISQRYSPQNQEAERQAQLYQEAQRLEAEARQRERESSDRHLQTTSVIEGSPSVVSALQNTFSDSLYREEILAGNENLFGFHTPVGLSNDQSLLRNAFKVRLDETQEIHVGDNLILRTMEEVMLATGVVIPRNTTLVATTSLSGNRMRISVDALEYRGTIIGVKWVGYDLSGQEGIYVPWSDEGVALQEFASGMAQTTGSTFTFNSSSAKEQVLADLARGAVRGGSNYLAKKINTISVTLKAGYQLYLMDTSNSNL